MAIQIGSAGPRVVKAVTLNPSAVSANSVSRETFTVSELTTDMNVVVSAPSLEAGLFLIQARVTAANTLELSIWNTTGAEVNPASQAFNVVGL